MLKKYFAVGTYFLFILLLNSGCEKESPSEVPDSGQGQLLITSIPDSAEIFVNQIATGKFTPDTITAASGSHVITLKSPGYLDSTFTFPIVRNAVMSKSVELTPGVAGSILFSTSPSGAFVESYQGFPLSGYTPLTINLLLPKVHKFKISAEGYYDTIFETRIFSQQTIAKHVALTPLPLGQIFINSVPSGALITLNNGYTGRVTPDTLKNLSEGPAVLVLRLTDYLDTTFTINVIGSQTVSKTVQLTPVPLYVDTFTDIVLYERNSPIGFSGLVLSTGTQVFSSSMYADIFFDGDFVKSQHLRTPAPATLRYTDFFNGVTGSNLDDGLDAPAYSSISGEWNYSKAITQNSYSFLYTNDLKYVKFKIIDRGGGTGPSDEWKWIKVSYKINQTPRDKRF